MGAAATVTAAGATRGATATAAGATATRTARAAARAPAALVAAAPAAAMSVHLAMPAAAMSVGVVMSVGATPAAATLACATRLEEGEARRSPPGTAARRPPSTESAPEEESAATMRMTVQCLPLVAFPPQPRLPIPAPRAGGRRMRRGVMATTTAPAAGPLQAKSGGAPQAARQRPQFPCSSATPGETRLLLRRRRISCGARSSSRTRTT